MFAGAGRFDGGIQGQQIGLTGDFLNDGYFGGNLLHGRDSLGNRFAPFLGIGGALDGNLLGLDRIVGVLLDTGGHLFHGRGNFLGGCRLLGGALRHLLSRGREFLASGSHVVGGGLDLTDNHLELFDHFAQGLHQFVLFAPFFDHHSQIALGHLTGIAGDQV